MKAHYRSTFAVILTAVTAWSMLTSLVIPVLPLMQRSLGTDQTTITWVLTAYLLAASVATPIVGRIGDSFGKKRTLVAVLVVFAIGVVLAGLAQSIGVMIAARALQGAGGAILPIGFGMLRDVMPKERMASSISITAAMAGVGGGVGIVLAGPISSTLDYHWLFWIPLVFVAAAIVTAVLFVPESPVRSGDRLDPVPALLLTGWLVTLLLAVSQGRRWGWTSPATLTLLGSSVVLTAGWVWSELRSHSPLVDMKMMRMPGVWRTNLVALLFGVCMYSLIGLLPQFLQTSPSEGYGFGASTTRAGLLLLPMAALMFVFGLLATPLARRIGSKQVLVSGASLTAVALAVITLGNTSQLMVLFADALFGAGLGLVFAAMSNIIVASVPATQTGVASGMNANIRTVGGSIGAAVTATLVTTNVHADGTPLASGYAHGFAFLLVAAVVATAAAVIVPGDKPVTVAAAPDEAKQFDDVVFTPELASVPNGTLVEVD